MNWQRPSQGTLVERLSADEPELALQGIESWATCSFRVDSGTWGRQCLGTGARAAAGAGCGCRLARPAASSIAIGAAAATS